MCAKSRLGTTSLLLLISTNCKLPATQSTLRLRYNLYFHIPSKVTSLQSFKNTAAFKLSRQIARSAHSLLQNEKRMIAKGILETDKR